MKVLVAPHNFEIGGSQINALELAESVANIPGFEIVVYAPDGVLVDDARSRGLDLHLTKLRGRPSPIRIAEMTALTRKLSIDLVHAYEWAPTLDAVFGPGSLLGKPVLSSIMSVRIPESVPKSLPMIVCMNGQHREALRHRPDVHLIEPPVDTALFAADQISEDKIMDARGECGVRTDELLVVVVSRIAASLKLDGLLILAAAARDLAADHHFRLAIVGDGPYRPAVEAVARETNASVGRDVVVLLGERIDPRPYYAAADVVVGMGGSALRGLSYGKPLLVQGEKGFWLTLRDDTLEVFLRQGWYGIGDGQNSVQRCAAALKGLLELTPEERGRLGRFGRKVVVENYGLVSAGHRMASVYRMVADRRIMTRTRVARPMQISGTLVRRYAESVRGRISSAKAGS